MKKDLTQRRKGAKEFQGICFAPLRLCVRSLFVCTALLLAHPPLTAQESDKPLLWGADLEGGMPYVFRDKDDPQKLVGFEKDLADALAKELHRPIVFKQYQFDNLTNGLIRGDFDFAMNGLEINPERQKLVRFVRPYYVYHQQLTVRSDEKRFKTLLGCLDLPDCTIATLSGTAAERLLIERRETRNPSLTVRGYESPAEAYSELARERADAVLMDAMIAQYYADPVKMKNAGRPTAKGHYGIAFRKEDKELADQVDAALGRLMANGRLRTIYRKWDLWNDAQEELMPGYLFEENDHERTAVPGSEPEAEVGLEAPPATGSPYWTYLKLLCQGAIVTVELTVLSFLMAVALGMPIAVARMYGPVWLRSLAVLYVELFRGLPVMLILVFIYFALPALADLTGLGIKVNLNPMLAAVIGLGLNYASYEAEVYRAGLGAIPVGQWEAAASLGMSRPLTFRRIILPQALRQLMPPMTNDLVALFKDTSIASAIAVTELNKEYLTQIRSDPSAVVVLSLVTAALYLIMSVPLGFLSRRLEKLWSEPAS
jgi:polar amino acid transport system substrate-binding protein